MPSFASGFPCINQRASEVKTPPNAEGFVVFAGAGSGFARVSCAAQGFSGSGMAASMASGGDGTTRSFADSEGSAVTCTAGASSTRSCSSCSTRRRNTASSKRTAALRLSATIARMGTTTSAKNKTMQPRIKSSSMFPPSLYKDRPE